MKIEKYEIIYKNRYISIYHKKTEIVKIQRKIFMHYVCSILRGLIYSKFGIKYMDKFDNFIGEVNGSNKRIHLRKHK